MQTTRRLAVLTVLAAVLIAAGALFLIAPVWQPQRPAAAYVPAAVHTAAPEAPTPIDINTATAEELTALPGLGPRKAAALVAYREAHGPFATVVQMPSCAETSNASPLLTSPPCGRPRASEMRVPPQMGEM